MQAAKKLLKAAIALTPYRVFRGPPNQFDGIRESLGHLAALRFEPDAVIDGGAHSGDFSKLAHAVFPKAEIHMIEPQPACREDMQRLAAATGFIFHPVAVGERSGTLQLAATDQPSTGAHVVLADDFDGELKEVPVTTLDSLLDDRFNRTAELFLKLDLQGFELMALKGGRQLLQKVAVVMTEVSFFAQAYEPSIVELVSFFDATGFDLFDVAALSARTRDGRLRQGDLIFVRRGSKLNADTSWA